MGESEDTRGGRPVRAGTAAIHHLSPLADGSRARYAAVVADIQKRGSYTPKRVREQRAYRLVLAGGVAGTVGVVGLVLAVLGVVEATLPIIALVIAAMCAVLFRRTVGR